ncbi:Asp-tRNA(Asn)/Glu-tRNA(Gln) amidotransferase subunit GatB [Candidatus Saccharibacteria bacterium]|nr:Asp-tRNA(Asn)/Glu-tRNA(Gln) amidotransferase subunit GatB [Candidatus Saccharibacteria bacterium]
MKISDVITEYTPTIGIECHVQLKTRTKLFAGVGNDAREAEPNTLISHICLGMPGALPVLNSEAVHLASRAAFALNTSPQKFSKFDRKHYFYPDLPKGYQISQYDEPIILGGYVEININDRLRKINITRAHLEEDAGKSTHPAGKDYSLVDLNRAGTPLLEIVSEPELHTAQEAKVYSKELYLLMRYADVSDANLYYGNMRFDVNVSVSKSKELGTRTETKNLNSFRSVEKAVDYEIKRQVELLEKGQKILQETRGWDDVKQKTFSQRSKEDAHDYRYFPDPDIPPVVLDDKFIARVKNEMPIMPSNLRKEFLPLNLDKSAIDTLIDSINAAQFLHNVISRTSTENAKRIAVWLAVEVQSIVSTGESTWEKVKLDIDSFIRLSEMVSNNELSSTAAKSIVGELIINGGDPKKIAKDKNLLQLSDASELEEIVNKVIGDNSNAAQDVKSGEMKAVGFLVGQVMKASGGKANPNLAKELIMKQIGIN